MKHNKIIVFTIVGIITSSLVLAFFMLRLRKKAEREEIISSRIQKIMEETSTEFKEPTTSPPESTTEEKDGDIHFINLGQIYYLEDEEAFKEDFLFFLDKNLLKTDIILTLSKVEDKEDQKKAFFYMQLDDAERTVIQVVYQKEKEEFSFFIYSDAIEDIEIYGGIPQNVDEKEILSTAEEYAGEEEEAPKLHDVQIDDLEDCLRRSANLKELKREIKMFLTDQQEDRRNLYVGAFEETEDGYEVYLQFENPRYDRKCLYVIYDAAGYHISLVNG